MGKGKAGVIFSSARGFLGEVSQDLQGQSMLQSRLKLVGHRGELCVWLGCRGNMLRKLTHCQHFCSRTHRRWDFSSSVCSWTFSIYCSLLLHLAVITTGWIYLNGGFTLFRTHWFLAVPASWELYLCLVVETGSPAIKNKTAASPSLSPSRPMSH